MLATVQAKDACCDNLAITKLMRIDNKEAMRRSSTHF